MNEFMVGQIVELKSGGPRMCVQQVIDTNVECVWFDLEKGKVHDYGFHFEVLKHSDSQV